MQPGKWGRYLVIMLCLSACGETQKKKTRQGASQDGIAVGSASTPGDKHVSEGDAVPKELGSTSIDDLTHDAGTDTIIVENRQSSTVPAGWPETCASLPRGIRMGMAAGSSTLFILGDDQANIIEFRRNSDGAVYAYVDGLTKLFQGVQKVVACGFGGNDIIRAGFSPRVVDGGEGTNQISFLP